VKPANPTAFTLIELLATIAIIVILLAILFPAAKTIVKSADNTRCIGNLRTLYGAFSAYKNDGGYWPSVNLNNDSDASLSGEQNWFVALQRLGYLETIRGTVQGVDCLTSKALVCPSNVADPGEPYPYTHNPLPWRPNYAMNFYWGEGTFAGPWVQRVTALGLSKSSAILLIDSTSKTGSIYPNFQAEWGTPTCAIPEIHNGGAHALLCNGSVISISRQTHPNIQDAKYWDPRQ